MIFKLKANAEFEAENIDDAFSELATYFGRLNSGVEPDSIFTKGEINIERVERT